MSFYLSINDGKWNPWLVQFFGPYENPLLEKPHHAATNLVLKLQFRLLSLQIPLFLAQFHKISIFEDKNSNC
jgi:hypothetical protein